MTFQDHVIEQPVEGHPNWATSTITYGKYEVFSWLKWRFKQIISETLELSLYLDNSNEPIFGDQTLMHIFMGKFWKISFTIVPCLDW